MSQRNEDEVRSAVRDHYGVVARQGGAGPRAGCCSPSGCGSGPDASLKLGYTTEDLTSVPEGADMGLGCGNPQAIAALRRGENVLDLGSGGGFDSFLAAKQVGETGHVIGVDMTPDMVSRARRNAETLATRNVEFRLGEIERLPVADGSVDVVLSNCVINLSPDKNAVFRETFRVLKPGGRLAISDVVATAPVPEHLASEVAARSGCFAGALGVDAIGAMLKAAGFVDIEVDVIEGSASFIREWTPGSGAENFIASASIRATRPAATKTCCGPSCCTAEAILGQ
jgi:arsenite methyltransferase